MKTTILLAVLAIFVSTNAKPFIPRPPINYNAYNIHDYFGGHGAPFHFGGFQSSYRPISEHGGYYRVGFGGYNIPTPLYPKHSPCEANNYFDVNIGNAGPGGTGGVGGVLGGMGGRGGDAADINGFLKNILQKPRSYKHEERQNYYVGGRPLYDENGKFQYNIRNRFEPIYQVQAAPAVVGDAVAVGADDVETGADAAATGAGAAVIGADFLSRPIYPFSKQNFVPIRYSDYGF